MTSYFFIILNVISLLVFGYDKFQASRNNWRIPERTLLLLTFLGGSIGSILGMFLFRHKISKPSFYISVIIIVLLQIGIVYYFGIDGLMEFVKLKMQIPSTN